MTGRLLLMTADAPAARSMTEAGERFGWHVASVSTCEEAAAWPDEVDILVADLRPLSRHLRACSAALLGLDGARPRAKAGLGIGSVDDMSGRVGALPLGLARYARVEPEGSPLGEEALERVFALADELAAGPCQERVDFNDHLPGPAFYHDLVESLSIPIVVIDTDDRIVLMNLTALALFGYAACEVFHTHWEMLVAPESRGAMPGFAFRLRHALRAEVELQMITRSGATFPARVAGGRIFRSDGSFQAVVLQVSDLSQRRILESQVVALQKAESIARLAGGIAHDFNNILGAVLGFARLALEGLRDGRREAAADIGQVIAAAERGERLTSKLIDLGRGGKYVVEPFDLAEVAGEVCELMAATLRPRFEVRPDLRQARVRGDRRQWNQVVTSLLLNAADAYSEGASVSVSTAELPAADIGSAFFRAHPQLEPGLMVRLRIADTCGGMDESTRARAFEPFFTTRAGRRGLGLSVVDGIVSNHRGIIELESQPGRGTSVTVYVPAAEDAVQEHQQRVIAAAEPAGRRTVLVVDDEALLREVAVRFLDRLGYETVAASGGAEAIRHIDSHPNEIDLVFLDLLMPGVDGRQVAEHVFHRHPKIPVLLVSGYVEQGLVGRLLDAGARGFVAKPYDMATLAEHLRGIFAASVRDDSAASPSA